ncbi:trypsin delta-like [Anopheles darlingi]|uniref:trypsin delta-like n=1 Tax=Anopheles darlingi TaxID=43151 RepID=UPI0021005C50|nr:trypsin delta-like [Anopheles darlingi]
MKQGVKLILLAVLFCAYSTKAEDAFGDTADPGTDEDPISFPDGIYQNSTNQQDSKRAGRIAGGTAVDIADYPYVVTLRVFPVGDDDYYQIGTIISQKHVITSAVNLEASVAARGIASIVVRAGSNAQNYDVITFEYLSYKPHDQYNSVTKENSVAIVTIKGSFSGPPDSTEGPSNDKQQNRI